MKIKEGFMLKTVGEMNVVVPVGKAQENFNGLITLNEAGLFLWKILENGASEEELSQKLCDEYGISEETATNDVKDFVAKIKKAGFLND